MDRRKFLSVCAIGGGTAAFAGSGKTKEALPSSVYALIARVQQHMFPEGSDIPGAASFHATRFLEEAIMDPVYDKDIRKFVIEGAEEFWHREKKRFMSYDFEARENALRAYEETDYGSAWLDRIMLLSLEGLLSDPIYGGNYRESGWKALSTKGGDPRPGSRYIRV